MVDVAIEEYKSLREESLRSIEQARHSLQLGLAAIAAITAFGATAGHSAAALQDVAIAVAAPLIGTLAWVLCLLELGRAVRAGAHNAVLEERINMHLANEVDGGGPLGWEIKMLGKYTHLGSRAFNWAIPLLLFAAGIPSVAVGVERLHRSHSGAGLWAAGVVDSVLLVVAIGSPTSRRNKWSTLRRKVKKPALRCVDEASICLAETPATPGTRSVCRTSGIKRLPASASVQIVRYVRVCGRIGHIGRTDICQTFVTRSS
jgi:hypothetical protein